MIVSRFLVTVVVFQKFIVCSNRDFLTSGGVVHVGIVLINWKICAVQMLYVRVFFISDLACFQMDIMFYMFSQPVQQLSESPIIFLMHFCKLVHGYIFAPQIGRQNLIRRRSVCFLLLFFITSFDKTFLVMMQKNPLRDRYT